MSLQIIMLLCSAALCLEQIERYVMYQRGWSGSAGEPITLIKFLFGIAVAAVCAAYFAISVSTSRDIAFGGAIALLLGVLFFQIVPLLRGARWRYVPGLVTELLLLCPLATVVVYRCIADDGLTAHGLFLVSGPVIGSLFGAWWSIKNRSVPAMPPMPPGPFGD